MFGQPEIVQRSLQYIPNYQIVIVLGSEVPAIIITRGNQGQSSGIFSG
jgi:hypothetical protein